MIGCEIKITLPADSRVAVLLDLNRDGVMLTMEQGKHKVQGIFRPESVSADPKDKRLEVFRGHWACGNVG